MNKNIPSAAIITRDTNVMTIVHLPSIDTTEPPVIVVFDSYPRPERSTGLELTIFRTEESAVMLLSNCLGGDSGVSPERRTPSRTYKAYIVQLRLSSEEERLSSIFEANMKLLSATTKLKSAVTHESNMEVDRFTNSQLLFGHDRKLNISPKEKNTSRRGGVGTDGQGDNLDYVQPSPPIGPARKNGVYVKDKNTAEILALDWTKAKNSMQGAPSNMTDQASVCGSGFEQFKCHVNALSIIRERRGKMTLRPHLLDFLA
jgi:hypothetical protein